MSHYYEYITCSVNIEDKITRLNILLSELFCVVHLVLILYCKEECCLFIFNKMSAILCYSYLLITSAGQHYNHFLSRPYHKQMHTWFSHFEFSYCLLITIDHNFNLVLFMLHSSSSFILHDKTLLSLHLQTTTGEQ